MSISTETWTDWVRRAQLAQEAVDRILEGTMTELHAVPISLEAMRACAARELALRRNVYPRWIKDGRYTSRKANTEIELMQAIVEHFDKLIDAEGRGL